MTSYNSFLQRYLPFNYPLPNQFWPYSNTFPFRNPSHLSFPFAQSQPSYPNCTSFRDPFPQQLLSNFNHSINNTTSQCIPQSEIMALQEKREIQKNKIQKTAFKPKQAIYIEISDDEGLAQPQKSDQLKSINITKTSQYRATTTSKNFVEQIKNKSEEIILCSKKQLKLPKQKEQKKQQKVKKIAKKIKQSNRKANALRQQALALSNRNFQSQRIIKKISAQRQPFRLTKKQKQMMQITFLRDMCNQIMTGPLFQARLPKFQFNSQEQLNQRNKIRQDLLNRQYVQQD